MLKRRKCHQSEQVYEKAVPIDEDCGTDLECSRESLGDEECYEHHSDADVIEVDSDEAGLSFEHSESSADDADDLSSVV